VTTKLPCVIKRVHKVKVDLRGHSWHHAEYVARSFDESLKNLGLDYVDLVSCPSAVSRQLYKF
jgi:aryl-alcohol dehydrogenase-like predicted oxidoreductase